MAGIVISDMRGDALLRNRRVFCILDDAVIRWGGMRLVGASNRNKEAIVAKAVFIGIISVVFALTGCNREKQSHPASLSWPDKVTAHLKASAGGSRIADAMETHGGYARWLENGVLHFRWVYHMSDRGPDAVVNTLQWVDPDSLEALHEVADSDIRFGWTGSDAWVHPADATFTPPPRFWSLTPFYFVGVPFVFGDLGANFKELGTFIFEDQAYDQVKVTYNPGSGDAPDDYYIVLIHPETSQVAGVRYIVTSDLVSKGGPVPEKLLTLEAPVEADGIRLPTRHRTFLMNGDEVGEQIRTAEGSGFEWIARETVDFTPPADAKVL